MRNHAKFFIFSTLFAVGCSMGPKGYRILLIMQSKCDVNGESKVLMKGMEIGRVEEVAALDSSTIKIKCLIYTDIRLPLSSMIKCKENIIGNTFIEVDNGSQGFKKGKGFVKEMDTLYGTYVDQFRPLDSVEKDKLMKKFNELMSTVDTIVNKRRDSL